MSGTRAILIFGAESHAGGPFARLFARAAEERAAAENAGSSAAAPDAGEVLDARPATQAQILSLCAARGVGLVVPADDAALRDLAQWRPALERAGVRALAPSPETTTLCQDAAAFARMLARYGYPAPEPDVAAPTGETIDIGVDLLMDLDGGRPLQAVTMERALAPGGKLKVARVIEAPETEAMAMRLGAALGLVGHNTLRARLEGARGPAILSLAPRFGDTAMLSAAAGLDSPQRILAMAEGDARAFPPRPIRVGEALYRAERDLIVPGVLPDGAPE